MTSLGSVLGKSLAVIVITLGGALLTCGGNFLISQGNYGNTLIIIWFIEVGVIFLGAVLLLWKFDELNPVHKKWGAYLFRFVFTLSLGMLCYYLFWF